MEHLNLDTGVRTFSIMGGGALKFNPADPGLYSRFYAGAEQLKELEQELVKKGEAVTGQEMLALFGEADVKIKALLNEIFGGENDFHTALGGVSLLAVGSNGKTVAQNLFAALEKILEEGAQKLVNARVQQARDEL